MILFQTPSELVRASRGLPRGWSPGRGHYSCDSTRGLFKREWDLKFNVENYFCYTCTRHCCLKGSVLIELIRSLQLNIATTPWNNSWFTQWVHLNFQLSLHPFTYSLHTFPIHTIWESIWNVLILPCISWKINKAFES